MDEDDSLLNEAFDYDAGENIAVTDVISFMQEIRAAPAERISELCNYFDDTDTMPFTSFIKLIQEFVEKKRNSFSDESSGEQDNPDFHNTNSNLEGCGGDISTVSVFEPDVGELLLKNKNLSRSNASLRNEILELRKQLDTYEEECEAQRQKIIELDKDLRQCQSKVENKPNIQLLLKDKDEMQNRILKQEEEIMALIQREKNLKEEEDDYRMRLSCLQDQYDGLSIVLNQLRKENLDLEQENAAVKSACDNFQLALDNKEEIIVMKTKECVELSDRIQEYEITIEDLQEEKEALSVQVREVQLEYSICQKAASGSAPGTPIRSSIHHELNLADECIGNDNYQSPICGPSYVKGNKQANSPLTETLKKGFLASLVQSPPSPREKFINLRRSLSEVAIQTERPLLSKTEIQTICNLKSEFSSQTEKFDGVETSTQTEIGEEPFRKDSSQLQEEDKVFDERSSQIQDSIANYQKQIIDLQRNNEELKLSVDREKSKSQYLMAQVGAGRAKLQSMQEMLEKEQDKVTELSDINIKLCSNKLDMWWEKSEMASQVVKCEKTTFCSKDFEITSRLVDALCLADTKPRKFTKIDPNILHGQDLSQFHLKTPKDSAENRKQIVLACDANLANVSSRFSVLYTCKRMLEEAITQKVEMLLDMMREIMYSDDFANSVDIVDLRKTNASFSRNLRSLQSLGTKLEKIGYCIGAWKEEWKMQAAVKTLSTGLSEFEHKYEDAHQKLQQLSTISLDCQCFCAINMLSVLKDVEKNPDEKTAITEWMKEVVQLNGPVLKHQAEKVQKYFDGIDKSIVATFGRLVPSKFRIMVLLFLLCAYLSFQWEDYHVPQVV